MLQPATPLYSTATLQDVVLTNNAAATGGGGAMVLSNLVAALSNVTCSNNGAVAGVGGCLNALQLGGLTISGGSVFTGNGAASGGALGISCGIACAGTAWACGGGGFGGPTVPPVVVSISQTRFAANGAVSQGGAVYARGGGLVLNGTSFEGNSVEGLVAQGGAVFMAEFWSHGVAVPLAPAGLSLVNSSFVRNMALVISSSSFPTELSSSTSAPGSGGALLFSSTASAAPLTASAGTAWVANYANAAAGAYVYGNAALTLAPGVSFVNNTATGTGGALLLAMAASLASVMQANLTGVLFSSNTAQLGGAVALTSGVAVAAAGCTLANNRATNGGAFALSVTSGTCGVALSGASTLGNMAATAGGLFYTDAQTPQAAPNVSCAGACAGNVAPNGANTLAAVPVRHTCSMNSTGTSIKSGQAVPAFSVSLYDGVGNLVVSAPDVAVTIASTSNGMAGTTAAPYINGAASFPGLIITELPGTTVQLTWNVASASLEVVNGQSGSAQVAMAPCDTYEVFDASVLKCVCAAGTALDAASSTCQLCPAGQYAPATGAAACLINTPGYASSDDRTQQIACPAGAFLNGTSLACSACEPGTYTSLAGQTTCQVNPAGTVSSPRTTQSCSLALAGVAASALGTAQQVTLEASIAATLNVSASAVTVVAVVDVTTRRRLASTSAQVNFTVVATGTAAAAAVSSSLGATAAFTAALSASLVQSGDPVLRSLTPAAITASPPRAVTVYLQAEPCPAGTYLNGVNQTCDACAVGTVAPVPASVTCTVCAARTAWLDATRACQPCPDNAVTSPTSPAQCACSVGYYDTLFGANIASPACAPCPLGGVCETGLLAADADWWRASTVSDVLYKCKVGNCLRESITGPLTVDAAVGPPPAAGDAPTNCADGRTGPLCSLCLDGYGLQSGECLPCPPQDAFSAWSPGAKTALVLLCTLAGLLCIAVAFFQPLSPWLEARWGAFTGAISAAFEKAAALPERCVRRCVPALRPRASTKMPSTSPEAEHAHAGAASEVPAHVGVASPRLSTEEAAAAHHLATTTAPHVTTGEEAAAAAKAARLSSEAVLLADREGEAIALAASASRRLVEMLSEEVTGGDGDGDGGDEGEEGGEEEPDDYYGQTGESLDLLEKLNRLVDKAKKCVQRALHTAAVPPPLTRLLALAGMRRSSSSARPRRLHAPLLTRSSASPLAPLTRFASASQLLPGAHMRRVCLQHLLPCRAA